MKKEINGVQVDVYKHYGQDVYMQWCDNYKTFLKSKNVTYTDLPIWGHNVIKYNSKALGCDVYAIIRDVNAIEECTECIYMFERMPDDLDLQALIDDCDEQHNTRGAEPQKMQTKASMILNRAYKLAQKRVTDEELKNRDPQDFMSYLDIPTATEKDIKAEVVRMGFALSDIKEEET